MNVIILAAGRGNSLAALTADKPKCMLGIGDETIIEHQIRILKECGISEEEISIVLGYKYDVVAVPDKVHKIINNDYRSTNNSYSLLLALENINDDVLVLDGDLIFDKDIVSKLRNSMGNTLLAANKDAGYGMTGIIINEEGKVLEIGKHVSSSITYVSMMKISANDLGLLRNELEHEENRRTWYTIPIANLLDRMPFNILCTENQVYEINSQSDYLEIKRKLEIEHNDILITGANGFLGKKIYHVLKRYHTVTGIKGHGSHTDFAVIDLTDYEKLSAYISLNTPNIIIHTAGIADPDICEQNKEDALRVNVRATENVVRICRKHNIKLIHISTDYVFDGEKDSEYCKNDDRHARNYYGQTKIMAEDIVRQYQNSLIVRIPIIYGVNDSSDKETFPIKILRELQHGRIVKVDQQQIRYPVLIDEVAYKIEESLFKNGVIHISSDEGVTKYDWAKIIAKEFGYDENLIVPQNANIENRPRHVHLRIGHEDMLASNIHIGTKILRKQLNCAFKLIYKSIPNNNIYGKNVGEYRYNLGKKLVHSIPEAVINKLDYIVPVPSSGLYYAMGFAEQSHVPYIQALIKPDSMTRSFQIADVALREKVIHDKIYAIPELLKGKTVALVDEAIFTGTTLRVVCDMVRACGAKGIYIFIPTPICKNECKQYVQPERKLLIDENGDEGLEEYFKVDGIYFQKYDDFLESLYDIKNICYECFGIQQPNYEG